MINGQDGTSLPGVANATDSPSQGRSQRPSCTMQDPAQSSGHRNARHRKHKSQTVAQLDGTVSDSVTNPMTSNSRGKKTASKQRQQSVAAGAALGNVGHAGKVQEQRQRPASLGGNQLLPATPQKEQAYAGPTFQASPAPSSLPVPKFFSRSVPNVAQNSMEARMVGSATPDHERSSPEPDVISPQIRPPDRASQQSPLDFFFQAQQAEQGRSASTNILSPELAARQVRRPDSLDRVQLACDGPFPPPANGQHRVPFQQRPGFQDQPISDSSRTSGEQHEAYTKSLKDLLFNEVNSAAVAPPISPGAHRQATPNAQRFDAPFQTPSPTQRPASGPSTPTPTAEQNHYSLHYGNRNLSPLFKSARAETPSRPSNLRQYSSASDSPFGPEPINTQPTPVDPASFSRNYLDQQIRAAQPVQLPALPFSPGPHPSASSSAPPSQHQQQYPRVPAIGTGNGASPRTASTAGSSEVDARAIRNMEDDLRRLLKVNVLGN